MSGPLQLLAKVRSLQRMQAWAIERRAQLHPVDETAQIQARSPLPPPKTLSTEERFWTFFERLNPKLLPPKHFAVYVRRVLQAVGGELRLAFAAPPQHGKTEVTLALMAFLVLEYPGKRWAYITYNQVRANSVARLFKIRLESAGVAAGGTLARMYLPEGGQMLFTSIGGGITGEPVDGAAFIDDPFKDRHDVDSPVRRTIVEEAYREAIETRVHPGASVFLLATRWHPEDLTGTLTKPSPDGETAPWEYINLRAIAEGPVNDDGVVADDPNGRRVGEVLFPERRPLEYLQLKRRQVLEFAWEALYQGRPRPRGGKIFHDPTFYTRLPVHYRGCFGIDLAYTAKTVSDWSVCLELWREENHQDRSKPLFYIRRVDRAQVEAASFALTLRSRHAAQKNFGMYWRASGTELGSASFLKRAGLPVHTSQPPGDKLVSATEVAIAWNEGRVMVPDPEVFDDAEGWLWSFIDIVRNFTGGGKEHDDDVDALGNAFAKLNTTAAPPGKAYQGPGAPRSI